MKRRTLLGGLCSSALPWPILAAAETPPPTAARLGGQRVLIIGAGWAGLSAAHDLRQSAPELDITVIDRESTLRPLPLSNPWLVGHSPARLPAIDLTLLAKEQGYRFAKAEVQIIDRALRQVQTSKGRFNYDWLVLASGIAYDYSAWFGDDLAPAQEASEKFPAGFIASELDLLKQQLESFQGGDLVMTVPPPPYRCTPAPYERAMLIGWLFKTRRIAGKLTILDAGAGMPRFNRLFAERYPQQIAHRPHTDGLMIDPFARKLSSDDGEMRFDHAIFLPPMRASGLVAQAGLLGKDSQGRPSRWAGVDPQTLRSPQDERVYLVGDLLDTVSPLFGHYPKTAHIATGLGRACARHIVAHSRGTAAPALPLPRSICHVWLDADPSEQLRLEAHYRVRGDGLITQTLSQHDNPQPRDEDLLWARSLYAEQLGVRSLESLADGESTPTSSPVRGNFFVK